jgi:hypothetical protein
MCTCESEKKDEQDAKGITYEVSYQEYKRNRLL